MATTILAATLLLLLHQATSLPLPTFLLPTTSRAFEISALPGTYRADIRSSPTCPQTLSISPNPSTQETKTSTGLPAISIPITSLSIDNKPCTNGGPLLIVKSTDSFPNAPPNSPEPPIKLASQTDYLIIGNENGATCGGATYAAFSIIALFDTKAVTFTDVTFPPNVKYMLYSAPGQCETTALVEGGKEGILAGPGAGAGGVEGSGATAGAGGLQQSPDASPPPNVVVGPGGGDGEAVVTPGNGAPTAPPAGGDDVSPTEGPAVGGGGQGGGGGGEGSIIEGGDGGGVQGTPGADGGFGGGSDVGGPAGGFGGDASAENTGGAVVVGGGGGPGSFDGPPAETTSGPGGGDVGEGPVAGFPGDTSQDENVAGTIAPPDGASQFPPAQGVDSEVDSGAQGTSSDLPEASPEDASVVGEDSIDPFPSEDAEPSPEGAACFPEDASVEVEGHGRKMMKDLKIGDNVLVATNTYSAVMLFTHRDPAFHGSYMQIKTAQGAAIRATSGHYIYVNDVLTMAANVKVGDTLRNAAGEDADVVSVNKVNSKGLYNPQTIQGDIVVDGIQASTFTTAVKPGLARMLLKPIEGLYRIGGVTEKIAGNWFKCGAKFACV